LITDFDWLKKTKKRKEKKRIRVVNSQVQSRYSHWCSGCGAGPIVVSLVKLTYIETPTLAKEEVREVYRQDERANILDSLAVHEDSILASYLLCHSVPQVHCNLSE
jgi:hypothetical protein